MSHRLNRVAPPRPSPPAPPSRPPCSPATRRHRGPGREEPASTPVPIATPDGVVSSYLAQRPDRQPRPDPPRSRRPSPRPAASWCSPGPQIGVVVAHAEVATFRADVPPPPATPLESVGATRTVPVSEGTPEGAQAPWGPGASGYKKDAKKDVNGDVGSEPTAAATNDPRETEQWDMKMIKADQAHEITDGNRNVARRRPRQRASTPTTRTSPPTSTSPTR